MLDPAHILYRLEYRNESERDFHLALGQEPEEWFESVAKALLANLMR